MRKFKSKLALLLVLTMLATMFVGVGVAQAKSTNEINKVVSVADDTSIVDAGVVFTVREGSDNENHFIDGDTFRIELPEGVKFLVDEYGVAADVQGPVTYEFKVDRTIMELTFDGTDSASKDRVDIPLLVEFDGALEGNNDLIVSGLDSGVTSGEYTFARVSDGKVSAAVDKVRKIARNSQEQGGTIELRENTIGAASGTVTVTVKLPSNFEWINFDEDDLDFAGGFGDLEGDDVTVISSTGRTLKFQFDAPDASNQRGSLYIPTNIKPSRDAKFGEVEVAILVTDDGTLLDSELVIAEYVDWGVTAKVAEVKELLAGKFDQQTAKITISEGVAGTLLKGRDLTLELPSWVKITDVKNFKSSSNFADEPSVSGKNKYIDIPIVDTTEEAGKIEFTLMLSIDGTKAGDIEAKIFGAGAEESTLVIAKAIAPISVSIDKVNEVKIGVQNQVLADVTITEGLKNAIRYEYKYEPGVDGDVYDEDGGVIALSLTEGAVFADDPVVEVTDGNLEIKTSDVQRESYDWFDSNSDTVIIPIKSESTKASTLKISNLKITLNRAIPEGDLVLKVGGPAVIENPRWANYGSTIDPGEFAGDSIDIVAAKVVTPADANVHAVSTFVIGNTVYQINGVDQAAMDQAPYIKNDRTYLPLRFVAYGLGIGDNGIIWDAVNQTVTLMKNDKVVQVKIGSTTMLVNGAAITMDTAPEITAAGRTCLPIRFVAEAFGANVAWDAATQTATITI